MLTIIKNKITIHVYSPIDNVGSSPIKTIMNNLVTNEKKSHIYIVYSLYEKSLKIPKG